MTPPAITRRRLIAAGALAVAGTAASYAPLVPGEGFERLVGDRLGIDEDLAGSFLSRIREQHGDAEYFARATLFALAFRGPSGWLAPESLRRPAAERLLKGMFDTPAANMAYVRPDRDPDASSCAGLVPVRARG